jgi:DNA-binding response OmpR family regulator
VIILDIGLPRQDGWTTCVHLRRDGLKTAILMLTARGEIQDRVKGLDSGADDYLGKPFHVAELVARIRALMRRPPAVRSSIIERHGVTLDPASHEVERDGHAISLTAKEFALLELLMRSEKAIVTRFAVMESLWDMNADPRSNVIDATVKLLRRKIDKNYSTPLIHTIRGVGFRFGHKEERCSPSGRK